MALLSVHVTYPNADEARKVNAILLEERLVACVNCLTVQSTYRWKGSIEEEDEILCIMKTVKANWDALRERIQELHSYEVPAIVAHAVESNESYQSWVGDEVNH